MAIHIKHPGLLHKKLHIRKGAKIPLNILEKEVHSKSPAMRREAQFALNARKFKHK